MPSSGLSRAGVKQKNKMKKPGWRKLSETQLPRVFGNDLPRPDPLPPGVVTRKIPKFPRARMHTASVGGEFLRGLVC